MLLHGDLGLDIFFVVSGFLVGIGILRAGLPKKIEDAGKRYATFLEKRLIRLFPAYFSLLMLLAMLPDDISQCTILHGPVLFLGHFLVPTEPCADHTWTLSTFLHLYAMSPPLIWGMWKCATEFVPVRYRSRVMIVCLVSLSLIISVVQEIYLLENPNEWIFSGVLLSFYMNPLTRCPPYLCGIAVAFVEYTKNDDIKDVNEEDRNEDDESEPLLESSKMIARKRRRYCSTSVRVFSLLLSILTILIILVIGPGTRRSFGSTPISEIDMGVGTGEEWSLVASFSRTFFGIATSYLLYVTINSKEYFASKSSSILESRSLRDVCTIVSKVSYGAYLFCFFPIVAIQEEISLGDVHGSHTAVVLMYFFLISILIILPLSLLLGTMSYIFVEVPSRHLMKWIEASLKRYRALQLSNGKKKDDDSSSSSSNGESKDSGKNGTIFQGSGDGNDDDEVEI
jgi:peptidoglycan/LPS O-acetylase OafA/YrhL